MCGFSGVVSQNKVIDSYQIIKDMTEVIEHRGPDDMGFYASRNVLLGHARLAIVDLETGAQPMKFRNYTLVYNGELYNTEEIREDLERQGYEFFGHSDTEVVLKGFVCYRERLFNKLNGIFAFSIYDGEKLYLVRDRVGVKPLYFSELKDKTCFASEIKSLLVHPEIEPIVKAEGLQELLGLGPSSTPGITPFAMIKEVKPAHYMVYDGELTESRYWDVEEIENNDTYEEAVAKVRFLVEDSIKRQLVSDVGISTFLSGGIDSSIITAVAAKELAKEGKTLSTYSIDYEGNDKNLQMSEFIQDSDNVYIEEMVNMYKTNHSYNILSTPELVGLLKDTILSRDLPGMADIDSSLLWLCKIIKKDFKVSLSGECADEIFAGYPWFKSEEPLNGFPWVRHVEEKVKLLKDDIKEKLNIEKYLDDKFNEALSEHQTNDPFKQLTNLNVSHFMYTLLNRKDRMSMYASLEVRVPFSDHRIIEYMYNLNKNFKIKDGVEKKILRDAFKDLLPEKVLNRKKNPYPKTHDPVYGEMTSALLSQRLENKNNILNKLFKSDELSCIICSKGECIEKPFFGQLMRGPQFLAYLYLLDLWAEIYKVRIEI